MISTQGLLRYGSLALLGATLSGCIVLPYGARHHGRGHHHASPVGPGASVMHPTPQERPSDRHVR